jgi:hypothetical protein
MVRIMSGGGITSNKYKTSKAGQKVEPTTHKANVPSVAQQGMAVQFEKKPLTQGPGSGYEPKPIPATGIPGKYNAATQGPGSQRTVYRSGAQSQYGPSAPGAMNRSPDPPATSGPGRDILSDYGPEVRRR